MVVLCKLVEAFLKLQTYTENHTEIIYIKKFSPLSLVDFSLSIQCKLRILGLIRARIFILLGSQESESMPRNQLRQPMWPGGPVRQPYSYTVDSPPRLFKIPALNGGGALIVQ